MSDLEAKTSAPAAEDAPSAAVTEVTDQLRGFAEETAALVSAIGRLASAEASLSLNALTRTIGLRLVGFVLLAFGVALLAVAGTIVLAHWLGSTEAALASLGLGLALVAALAFWRARIWGARIGFTKTREALGTPPAAGPKP